MGTPHHITILPLRQSPPTPPGGASATLRRDASHALAHGHPPARSLYIHTPFCFHKCHYCDFYSIVDTQERQEAFLNRLLRELRALAPHAAHPGAGLPLKSIFIGGGTPSMLRLELWERLLETLNECFGSGAGARVPGAGSEESGTGCRVSGVGLEPGSSAVAHTPSISPVSSYPKPDTRHPEPDPPEFTVECNPESSTPELMALLRAGGVNRVSIGAQSFNPRHLKTLERWHNPENVPRAVEAARAAGIPRQSIDLIYAIPGQTMDEWDADLRTALSLGTTHLSCYSLTYEPNTAMTARLRAGEFAPADEDLDTDMFIHTAATLAAAGLPRYEVSNFARPGHESLHNLAYWRQEQWLAAGPSASGHVYHADGAGAGGAGGVGGYRWKNVPRLGDYLDDGTYSLISDLETPDPARALRERLMMGIRITEGLDAAGVTAIAASISPEAPARLERTIARLVEQGLLHDDRARWRLTEPGFLMTDGVAAQLMACV
jgi:oxygen-independent coproporphyrinogen-3 oxidase